MNIYTVDLFCFALMAHDYSVSNELLSVWLQFKMQYRTVLSPTKCKGFQQWLGGEKAMKSLLGI